MTSDHVLLFVQLIHPFLNRARKPDGTEDDPVVVEDPVRPENVSSVQVVQEPIIFLGTLKKDLPWGGLRVETCLIKDSTVVLI